ncbi:MAG: hypothetical protein L0Z55_04085 [Planctomycetes bacterium]|nr:hypothetical protein [Planctomycetota bacterium]
MKLQPSKILFWGLSVCLLGFASRSSALDLCRAQDDGERGEGSKRGREVSFVELSSVTAAWKQPVTPDTKKRTLHIKVAGKTPKLPEGTQVTVHLCWRRETLQEFSLTIDRTKRFSAEFAADQVDACLKDVFIRTLIAFEKQPPEVQEMMTSHPETFWLGTSPWTEVFHDKRFDLGTDEERQKEQEEVREFFKSKVELVSALHARVREEHAAAIAKQRFQKNGAFDAPAWQRWMEREVRTVLRATQQEIRDRQKSSKFLPHGRDLGYLVDITNAVARIAIDNSKKVYEAHKVEFDNADLYPEKIDTNTSKNATDKFIETRKAQLLESQRLISTEDADAAK